MSRKPKIEVASYKGRRIRPWMKALLALVLAGALAFAALLGVVLSGAYDHVFSALPEMAAAESRKKMKLR